MVSKQELLQIATEAAIGYLDAGDRSRVGPDQAALDRLAVFDQISLDAPIGPERALELLAAHGSPATMRTTGGRYFGFVNGGVTGEALAASVLASAWDQNVALPAMSPAAAAIDAAAARLIVDALGLAPDATAAFCAGATVANITAIVAARDDLLARAGWSIGDDGMAGAPPITAVLSAEAHVSIDKALRIAGIGRAQQVRVGTDRWGRLDASQLPPPTDRTLVIAQAGNVNTGHSDPFDAIIDHYESVSSWLHVDGAFGLWANAAPKRRRLVAGVERADSWATDSHKWLNGPYDAGVVICADGASLAHAMTMVADYVPVVGDRTLMNLGLQMSQRARAVPIWAALASRGRADIAASIEHTCRCAERFAVGLSAAGAEVLAPVVLNQALVAFGDDETTDGVIDAVQRDGTCWMGGTTWHDRRAMRISVSNIDTTFADVDRSIDAVLAAWQRVTT